MPVEIKELHIKVTVNAPGAGNERPGGTPAAPASPSTPPASDKEALVAECVEQVLQILRAQRDR